MLPGRCFPTTTLVALEHIVFVPYRDPKLLETPCMPTELSARTTLSAPTAHLVQQALHSRVDSGNASTHCQIMPAKVNNTICLVVRACVDQSGNQIIGIGGLHMVLSTHKHGIVVKSIYRG